MTLSRDEIHISLTPFSNKVGHVSWPIVSAWLFLSTAYICLYSLKPENREYDTTKKYLLLISCKLFYESTKCLSDP